MITTTALLNELTDQICTLIRAEIVVAVYGNELSKDWRNEAL